MRVVCLFSFLALCLGNRILGDQIKTVPYDGARITILELANGPSTYYTLPLARLLPDSAKAEQNVLTGRNELSFDILMWNSEATEAVHRYLNPANVSNERVEPLPLEKVRLVWNDSARPLDSAYRLVDGWRSHSDQSEIVNFQISCQNLDRCNALMTALKTEPETFYALEMQYTVSPLVRREVTVTGGHVKRTDMYSKLARMTGVAVFVSTDVVDELAAQTVAIAVSSFFPVNVSEERGFANALKRVLEQEQVLTLTSFLPGSWETVYWEPSVCRPDKVARNLNSALRIDPSNRQNFILNNRSLSSSACASGLDILSSISNRTRAVHSSSYTIPEKTVREAIRERQGVGWNGTHFNARPAIVYRVDLRALNGTKSLVRKMVPILGSGSPLGLKVRAQDGGYTSRLEVAELQTRLETEFNNLVLLKSEIKRRTEMALAETKMELTNNLTSLKSEMSTKMELANTRIANNRKEFVFNLRSLKSELSTKMELTNTKMADIKVEFANNLTSLKSELSTKIDLADSNLEVSQKLELFNSVTRMSTKFEVDVTSAISEAKRENANMLRSSENRTRTEVMSMKRTLARELGPANALVTRTRSVSRAFDNWPDYCRLRGYFCETYTAFNERRYALSVDACRRDCDADSRCVSFDFRSNYDVKCILYHYICPFWYNDDHDPTTQYVKLSRVPILTTSMWKSLWTRGTLGSVPRDPCQLLGEHDYNRG